VRVTCACVCVTGLPGFQCQSESGARGDVEYSRPVCSCTKCEADTAQPALVSTARCEGRQSTCCYSADVSTSVSTIFFINSSQFLFD
jgi:hypothetical protein